MSPKKNRGGRKPTPSLTSPAAASVDPDEPVDPNEPVEPNEPVTEPAPAAEPEPTAETVVESEPTWDLVPDKATGPVRLPPAEELTPASPRELKRLIADWRDGRATRNLWEAFHDAYIGIIAALMIGGTIVNVVLQAQRTVSRCSSVSCLSARAILPWAALGAVIAVVLMVARLFGPVLASAAEGFWLLDAPISRSKMLRARLVAAVVGAFIGGLVIGGLVAALTGLGLPSVIVWAIATALAAAAAISFAAAQQGIERHRLTVVANYVFGLVAFGALVVVIGIAAGWFQLGFSAEVGIELGLALAGFSALVLLASLILAALRLRQIRRARLLSGGALVAGISGAFFALDIGLARDIVVERRAMDIGHVKPQRGHGIGPQAIMWREWQRLRRFPQPLLVLAATMVVPYAADALGMSVLTPVFSALALFGAVVPMLGGLRVLTRTGGLARCLPMSLSQIKLASIAVPAILTVVWIVLTAPAYLGFGEGSEARLLPEATAMALAVGAAGLLGAVRWVQAKPVDFGAPMVSSQAGAFPPGLFTNLFKGFDICVIATAPMLLGFSPLWSLIICAITALVLLNSVDAEALRVRQAEQQKQIEAARKQREALDANSKQRKR